MEDELHIDSKHSVVDYMLAAICVVAGCVTMFLLIDLNSGGDEVYQSLCVRNYMESPLGLLTYFIGDMWSRLFGFSVLKLRVLASVEIILAVCVTSGWLYGRTRNLRLSAATFLLSCILMRAGSYYFYNWDTGTYLFDATALCLLMTAISRPTIRKCVLLGVAIALMTLGRVASGIFLPVVSILVYFACRKDVHAVHEHKDRYAGIVMAGMILIGWTVTMLLLTTAICGSPADYLSLFSARTVVSGHNPVSDIHMLWGRLAYIMLQLPATWFFGIVCLILGLVLIAVKKKTNRVLIFLPWLIFCLLTSYWNSRSSGYVIFRLGIDTPLGLGLLSVIPVYSLYRRGYRISRQCGLKLWACALATVSYAFGSDGFTERMVMAFILPVIVAVLWTEGNGWVRRYTRCVMIVSLLSFSTIYYCHFAMGFRMREEMTKCDLPVLEGVRISKEDTSMVAIKDVAVVAERLRREGKPFVYLGDERKLALVYGLKTSMPFHMYHHSWCNLSDWNKYKDLYAADAEYVVYHSDMSNDELPAILSDVRGRGFTDSISVGKIVILNKPVKETCAEQGLDF